MRMENSNILPLRKMSYNEALEMRQRYLGNSGTNLKIIAVDQNGEIDVEEAKQLLEK